jgi:outer membrane protein TolC
MKKLLLLILFQGILFAQSQVTLDDCHEKAKANFPLIKQYDLISQATEYTLSNANKAYLPQVKLNVIGGYIIQGLPSVTIPGQSASDPPKTQLIGIAQVNQVLWDGGATRTAKDIAQAAADVEKAGTDVSVYTIRERVNQVYFGILLIDEQLKQLEILKENLDRNLNRVQLSKDNGLAYQSDVDEVKAELLNLEQKRIEFRYTRRGYIEMLALFTGQPFTENIEFAKPVVAQDVLPSEVKRPELNLYTSQLKLNEMQAGMNKVSLMPKVGLMGAGVFMTPGMNFGTSKIKNLALIGLSASWKIDGLYKNSNNKDLDRIKAEKIVNQQETFLFTNSLQLSQSASEIEKQKAIIAHDDEIVKLKTNITKSYQSRFDNGMCTMNDLINSMNRESESRASQALHGVQLLMSLYNYQYISGN